MMTLKIILPFQQLLESPEVSRIVAETKLGSFGLWPQRLDCVALLVAGIITYETAQGGEQHVAADAGILIKTGANVSVSVRHAVTGGDLGELRKMVEETFLKIDEQEKKTRSMLARMESEIIHQSGKLHHV